jgi:V/A-type H+-transporting ATPase subunit D
VATLKLTKTELRLQQIRNTQLNKYLPTLQLKKAMLQVEVSEVALEIEQLWIQFQTVNGRVSNFAELLSDTNASPLFDAVRVREVIKRYENIAGIELPHFEGLVFEETPYALFDTPIWLESAISGVKELVTVREKIKIAEEKKRALEKELREVSIRVNLFEKILIPRARANIKKIAIFLSDLQLAAVSVAKISKKNILQREMNK